MKQRRMVVVARHALPSRYRFQPLLEDVREQHIVRPATILRAPDVRLAELHLAKPPLRHARAAVSPRFGVRECAMHASDDAGLALDEPRRAMVVGYLVRTHRYPISRTNR